MAFLDNFSTQKPKSFFDNFQTPTTTGGSSNTPVFNGGINLTNQNFGIGGSTTPQFTNTNITPTSIFNKVGQVASAVLPGARALIDSATQMSLQPYRDYLAETAVKNDPFIRDESGNRLALNKEAVTNTVLGFTGNEGVNKIIKNLVKEESPTVIKSILSKEFKGVSSNLFDDIAPKIAKSTDEKEISSLINNVFKNPSVQQGLPQQTQSLSQASSNLIDSSVARSPSQISVSSPNSTPEVDPVKQITDALKAAKPIRKEQEALYSAERGKRVGAIVNIGKNTPGEKGYFAQLGALKGELPKAQFESIRKKVTQDNVDKLFDMVEKSNVTPFEKINAKSGLSKILGAEGGSVPTKNEIELLSEIFPSDFIKTVMDQRPLTTKLWGTVKDALNLPRAIMATADLSAPLRQGIMLVGKPKQWAPAFAKMFKYAFSENAYNGLMKDIQSRPTYQLMRENKLALTEVGEVLSKREESFMSNLTERIPLFGRLAKGSNRAYSGFLNKLRADTFDDLVNKATELGLTKDNPKLVADVAKFVNTATGRGDLPAILQGSTDLLNGAFFSPRLMASRLQSLNPVYYTKLDPFVRKEALKSLFTVTGVGLSVLGLAKLNGAEVSADPRSADFGKIKIGDTRYDPWGGFQQYVVLASRLLTGEMVNSTTGKEFKLGEGYKPTTRLDIIQRFFESKTSPIASFALGLLKGQTTMGEDLNIPADVADRFIPMIAQDMFDLYRENGPKGFPMAIPGIFGVGSQTYSDQVPMKTKTPTGKDSIKWRQAPNLGETLINKVTGKQITTIPEAEQQKLRDQKLADTKREIDLTKAKSLVLETGEPQDVGDTHVFLDNGVVKTSTSENAVMYSKIQTLKESGKIEEAQSIIKAMTDKEYKDYDSYRKTRNTRTMNNFLKTDPAEAVKFVRAQSPAEQQRLLKTMNDEEYALYEQGKKLLQ